jgi:uroporphyrinogen-III synthase
MKAVLSTKRLTEAQKNLILNANLSLTEFNAIQTKALGLSKSVSHRPYENAIITSQTTVDLVKELKISQCFCVGQNTAEKLKALGFKVEVIAKNAKELAKYIVDNYADSSFDFFGSLKRRPELSNLLEHFKVELNEIFVYDTVKTPKKFNRSFDAVLCFSPSGVESFFEANPLSKAKIVCIGHSTANTARIFSESVFISNSTSIESVIVKTVKLLKPKKSR